MTPERWQQIEALYHAAHALPPDERAAFLARTCAGDDGLQREVERLLSQPGSDEGFLAGGAVALAGGLPAARVGQTLGAYHLEELIGVGGMGEVYRARDEKLGRQVAIKVLPPAFTEDAARLARFEREARTLAALNHPNICAIHGFEQADTVRFLVLELVEGGTLDDRLASSRRQPGSPGLPEREALHIARQIARALDFAHQRGIVHRDLKPANIKVGADGTVKVVDFGLAKAAAPDANVASGPDGEHTGAGRAAHTIEGTIVGTPAYMSPEQARGAPIDKRADVWAFGCVLYEMLTGRAAFSGGSVADTIAAVLQREPDWAALPASTPLPIRNLLLGCLAKDSQDRLRDIGDVRITIDSILSGSPVAVPAMPAAPSRARTTWLPWVLAGTVVLLAIAGITIWRAEPPPASAPALRMRSIIELPGQALDRSGGAHVIALSHDGTLLAYVASPGYLYLRPIGDLDATPIEGTEAYKGVREPAFSPDDKKIAFYAFADQTLKWMAIPGSASAAVTIGPIGTPTGIDWSEKGILYGQGRNGIFLVSPNGQPKQIAQVEANQEAHGPQMLPDGDHFLFTVATGRARDRWDKAQIVVQSLTTNERRTLPIIGSDARLVAGGYLVYAIDSRIFAVRFDPARLEVQGTGVPVEDGVSRAAGGYTGAANFSLSNNGLLSYVPGPASATQAPMDISLFDPIAKKSTKLGLPADQYDSLRIAPDGSRIAFVNARDKERTIHTYDTRSGTIAQPLTAAGSNSRYPAWTYDSRRLAFQSDREGDDGIWWQEADGSDTPERLTTAKPGESHIPESWSANRTLLYSNVRDGVHSLATLSLSNGNWVSQPFGRSRSTDPMSGVFSPDGRLVAYTLTQLGTTTICVEPFPATSAPFCLPPAKADSPKHPRWAPNGSRLYYDPRFGDFESIAVVTQPELRLVDPRPEPHPFRLAPMGERTPYDVSMAGKILGLTTPGKDGFETQIPNKIIAVTNWPELLKQRVSK